MQIERSVMKSIGLNEQQLQQMKTHPGFIAALDQSGGSTPGALRLYGIKEGAWSNEYEMLAIAHQMRLRIILSPASPASGLLASSCSRTPWTGTLNGSQPRTILWNVKRVMDRGLAAEKDGVHW
jgi:fructose-bisphosphate aldolase, class I